MDHRLDPAHGVRITGGASMIEMLSYVLATLFLVGLAFDLEKRTKVT
jgi:hypothetical protein